jgi:hypothetical protein
VYPLFQDLEPYFLLNAASLPTIGRFVGIAGADDGFKDGL